ncbi:transposase [Candidatus Poribacteria bacterium]|nr:transposase [Candidatus Poribacteria bacterium]
MTETPASRWDATRTATVPSYTQLVYHIVFGTKRRRPTLDVARRRDFLACSCSIVQGMKGHVYRINCVEDHLHMLVGLPST